MKIEKKFVFIIIISIGALLLVLLAASRSSILKTQPATRGTIQGSVTEIFPEKNMVRVYDADKGAVYSVTVSPDQLKKDGASSINIMDTVTVTTNEDTSATQIVTADSFTKNSPASFSNTLTMPAELTSGVGSTPPPPGAAAVPIGANLKFSF